MSNKHRSLVRLLCLVCAGLFLCGCEEAKPDRPPTQQTHGTIKYNGKVPNGAVVQLWPLPIENVSWRTVKPAGRVEPDGTFKINTYELNDGAAVGEYAVTVLWTGDNPDLPRPDLFSGRFSNPGNPVMKITIVEGENALPPILLTGPAVTTEAGWIDPVTGEK